jgi:hypothetical protein
VLFFVSAIVFQVDRMVGKVISWGLFTFLEVVYDQIHLLGFYNNILPKQSFGPDGLAGVPGFKGRAFFTTRPKLQIPPTLRKDQRSENIRLQDKVERWFYPDPCLRNGEPEKLAGVQKAGFEQLPDNAISYGAPPTASKTETRRNPAFYQGLSTSGLSWISNDVH